MKRIKQIIYFFIMLSFSSSCASAQIKLDAKPYTIESSTQQLKKNYPFVEPIQLENSSIVNRFPNVVYKKASGQELTMTIYTPKSKLDQPASLVVLIHGGGWASGSKENQEPMAQALAEKGYVAATVGYRLSNIAKYPAAVNDIKDAIRFLKNSATEYSINPNQVAVLGASAGAQLATLIGVTPNSSIFHPSIEGSDEVQAIVNVDGITSFIHPEAESEGKYAGFWLDGLKNENYGNWKQASPLEYVSAQTPPTLFINSAQPRFHAGRDDMVEKMSALGIYSEVREILNTPHSFWLSKPWFRPTVEYTVNFLNQQFEQGKQAYRKIIVAQDGSGEFKTIQEAINSTRDLGPGEVLIYIKNGTYHEKIDISSWKHQLTLQGESRDGVIITNDDYSGKINPVTNTKHSTFTSYTVKVSGNDIRIENLTIKNSSCDQGQAVALHVEGDRFFIQDSNILGCQDTVYASKENSRQYYFNCFIEGTTDFIFGEAIAVFENCEIKSLKNSYITAAATPKDQHYGFTFLLCTLTASEGVTEVYLGRPWRPFAQTVFINTKMGKHILPSGWNEWSGDAMFPDKEKTTYYAEYGSFNLSSSIDQRVPWSHQISQSDALQYNLQNIFYTENSWLPF